MPLHPLDQLTVKAYLAALPKLTEPLPPELEAQLREITPLLIDVTEESELTEAAIATLYDLIDQHPELATLYALERQALQPADQQSYKFSYPEVNIDSTASDNGEQRQPLPSTTSQAPAEPASGKSNATHVLVPYTNLVTPARRSPAPAQVQRFVLRDRPTAAERQYYQTYIAKLQQLNTNWKILPDQPKSGEAAAHVAIYQDADADVRYTTYLMTRCIEDVMADFRFS